MPDWSSGIRSGSTRSTTRSSCWFQPKQPVTVEAKGQAEATLVLKDFTTGKTIDAKGSAEVSGDKQIDVTKLFPQVAQVGTYVLYTVPKGKSPEQFEGTPLVIESRPDRRRGDSNPVVVKVEPLRYAVMTITLKSSYLARPAPCRVAASAMAEETTRAQVDTGSELTMPSTPKSSPFADGDSITPSL